MGNTCSQSPNCTVEFDSTTRRVTSFGDVTVGNFETDPDIAGTGTVGALIGGALLGLVFSFVIAISLILDRIPRFINYSYDHYILRHLVPSPSQLLPKESWPSTVSNYKQVDESMSSSVNLPDWHQQGPGHSEYDPGYPTMYGTGQQHPPQKQFQNVQQPWQRPQQGGQTYSQGPRPPLPGMPHGAGHNYHRPQTTRPQRPSSKHYKNQVPVRVHVMERVRIKFYPPDGINHRIRNTSSEKIYDILEAMLFCIHDAQILLAIALGLSFYFGTNCSMSQYHLDIAINLALMGCMSFTLALTLVRNYWKAPFASLVRIGCFVAVMVFIWRTIDLRLLEGLVPEYSPPRGRNDSLILLEAACFSNKTYATELTNLTESEIAIVGATGENPSYLSYYILRWVLLVAAIGSGVIRFGQLILFKTNGPARWSRGVETGEDDLGIGALSFALMLWWILVWIACAVVGGATIQHVISVRDWVHQTDWIEPDEFSKNPEQDARSFGQIAAIVATGAILIAGLDHYRPRFNSGLEEEESEE